MYKIPISLLLRLTKALDNSKEYIEVLEKTIDHRKHHPQLLKELHDLAIVLNREYSLEDFKDGS
jgi:hypothetical protein